MNNIKVQSLIKKKEVVKAETIQPKKVNATTLAIEYPAKYKKEMQLQREGIYTKLVQQNEVLPKIFYHVDVLISLLDSCLGEDYFKHELRAKAKALLKLVESYNAKMYSPETSEKCQIQISEVITEQEEIFNIVNNVHSIYYTELLKILKNYEEGHSVETINKSILDSQFAMFKDFHIETIVKQQVKRIEPNADYFNILHLSEIVTREKLSKLSKLNPLTMEVMDKIMRNAQISW